MIINIDYRETKLSLSAIIDSETEKKAKSIFKKEFDKSAKFNGHSPSHNRNREFKDFIYTINEIQ